MHIRQSNREEFGRVEIKKVECLKQLEEIERQDQLSPILEELKMKREGIRKNYLSWLKLEETCRRQKSRMNKP